MTDKQQQLDSLRQHFGGRVKEQSRNIVSLWSQLPDLRWNQMWHQELLLSLEKVHRSAERHGFTEILVTVQELLEFLNETSADKPPDSSTLESIDAAMRQLSRACSRSEDVDSIQAIRSSRKTIYLASHESEALVHLQHQLEQFGWQSTFFDEAEALQHALSYRLPAALIMDLDFDDGGIEFALSLQDRFSSQTPTFFYSNRLLTIEERIAAVRAQAVDVFEADIHFSQVLESLNKLFSERSETPFKVLLVDDSVAQSRFAEKVLNSSGIFTRIVNDPMNVFEVMETFAPEAILMDMYMPGVTGPELAQVIRQQTQYDALPIIYLSAEDDVTVQLSAVAKGGDDFLTKPVSSEVLTATVLNRCRRYRVLREQMIRDSLTGLFNHNHLLQALRNELTNSANDSVNFVMIDIDNFKSINDRFGHSMGDQVIRSLGLFLRQRFRSSDTIGRYGGEEFAIVLPNAEPEEAVRLINQVRENFSAIVHQFGDASIQVTFSSGIAAWDKSEDSALLVQRADQALYQSKHEGRNRVSLASLS